MNDLARRFKALSEELRLQILAVPGQAMYVGDHPINDVDAAKAAGLITVWNRREGKHVGGRGATRPDHVIFNFWDLLELLEREMGLRVREPV